MLSKLFKQIIMRKFTTGIALLVIAGGAYFGLKGLTGDTTAVEYVTAAAERGTLVLSISGSGQVGVSDRVDIKPKVSSDVMWVGIKVGQEVGLGQTLARLDDTDAKKAVADAELDLEETKLKLDKDIAQAPIDYERKLELLQKTTDNLENEYEDTFNTVSNTFLDLPAVMTGLSGILFDETVEEDFTNESAYRNLFSSNVDDRNFITTFTDISVRDYNTARDAYDTNFINFKNITRFSERAVLEAKFHLAGISSPVSVQLSYLNIWPDSGIINI